MNLFKTVQVSGRKLAVYIDLVWSGANLLFSAEAAFIPAKPWSLSLGHRKRAVSLI